MGVISNALNSALENLGRATMDVGNSALTAGYGVWERCCRAAVSYLAVNPQSAGGNAWATVTGSIFSLSLGMAASLSVLFFVIGWLHESVDVRNNFTLENMFRFFIRYVITATLIVNCLSLVTGVTDTAAALTGTVAASESSMAGEGVVNVFTTVKDQMESEEAGGTAWLGTGIISMIAGLFGGIVIMVCAVQLVLSVLTRLFKLYLCIPFGPVALSSFAGGQILSQTGISWIKSFLGYALEAVVMALAIRISFALFADGAVFSASRGMAGITGAILTIVEYCLPMITACACVKGAEVTVRRCLGLG